MELDPKNESAYADLVRAYSLSGNISAGLEAVDKYLYLYPGFKQNDIILAEMYRFKGLNLLGQYKSDEAKKAWQKALQLNPSDKEALEMLQSLNK